MLTRAQLNCRQNATRVFLCNPASLGLWSPRSLQGIYATRPRPLGIAMYRGGSAHRILWTRRTAAKWRTPARLIGAGLAAGRSDTPQARGRDAPGRQARFQLMHEKGGAATARGWPNRLSRTESAKRRPATSRSRPRYVSAGLRAAKNCIILRSCRTAMIGVARKMMSGGMNNKLKILMVLAFGALAGCNTIAGIGEDIADSARSVQGML